MNAPAKINLSAPLQAGREARAPWARAPKIALLGLFGNGNFGNDGSLEAMLAFLRRGHPEAQLACICGNPDLIRQKFALPTIPLGKAYVAQAPAGGLLGRARKVLHKIEDLFLTIWHIRKFDVVIVPGTGILDDFGERPYGMPWDILRWCFGARLMGARVAFVSIGAGPIRHPLSRWLMKAAARLAHYRSYRDTISKEFMTDIGLKSASDPVYPDIAFSLEAPQPAARRGDQRLNVGIGVMSYYGWYGFADGGAEIHARYMEKLSRFAVYLLNRGHRVRLLTGETTDTQAVADLMRRVTEARPQTPPQDLISEPSGSLHDLMRQMVETDIVVATRFHNIVCALKLGKPSISLGYARKNDVLMAQAGLETFCQHVEQFDVETLIGQFESLTAGRRGYEQAIRAHAQAVAARLAAQEAMLSAELLQWV
jgi:polysaccharide pyruvyl transferase WcaK-like protein